MTPSALLIDFGGVLTSNVFEAFAEFCEGEGLKRDRFADLMRADREAQRLLRALETGQMEEAEFERELAPMLGEGVRAPGLLDRLTASLRLDEAMVGAVAGLRAAGVTTVLVSNSLGYGPYAMADLDGLFDAQVISGEVGVRKPSGRIYELALERAGVAAAQAVFVDDFDHNVVAARRHGLRAVLHTDSASTIPQLSAQFGIGLEGR